MERQETSLERFSVSHPSCLCFFSVPWRNSILAGRPVGPAAARGSPSGCPLYTGSHARWFFSCVLLSGAERGFQNPRREHRIWHSRGEAFRGVGRGILSMCRGSFRNGVEGSYLKKLKNTVRPYQWRKMGLMFAGQTNGPEQGAGEVRLRLFPGNPPCERPATSRLVLYTAVLVYLEFTSNSRDLSCFCPFLRPRGPSVCCRDLWSR